VIIANIAKDPGADPHLGKRASPLAEALGAKYDIEVGGPALKCVKKKEFLISEDKRRLASYLRDQSDAEPDIHRGARLLAIKHRSASAPAAKFQECQCEFSALPPWITRRGVLRPLAARPAAWS